MATLTPSHMEHSLIAGYRTRPGPPTSTPQHPNTSTHVTHLHYPHIAGQVPITYYHLAHDHINALAPRTSPHCRLPDPTRSTNLNTSTPQHLNTFNPP